MLPDCSKPTENKRIAANKQKYLDAKKKAKADQTGSSAPPSLPHGTNNTQPSQRTIRTNNGNGNNGTPCSERPSKWKAVLKTDSSGPVPMATNLTSSTLRRLVVGI
jgi:hypothetical protein